ncbi:hypothetical protein HCG69_11850 [Bacteroides sp. K03]|uniref:hypothetical protein n=1 Tax=Bacteroides sp. K03 TaxID=2718928 RepID=UPI001C8B445E|nr:hypothetical protein [Bacteroides sp. K03]MBX9188753.1 hypothetical protein [Bacteroides sp. K03]
MKTLKLFVCATLLLLSACVDFEEKGPDVSGIDTGAYLTAVKMTDAKGNDVVVSTNIPTLITDANKQEQLKDPSNTEILITVKPEADVTNLKLVGTLSNTSSAASISPKMGVLADFSSPRTYTVTSYNKKNIVAYSVRVIKGQ